MSICPARNAVPCLDAAGQDQALWVGIDGAGLVKVGLPDGSSVLLTWQAAERLRAHLASTVSAILRGE